ncbi:metal-dependent phosphohydrolase [Microcoleus sp. FACHB-1515]|uniref:metal-dependent phosphohydrolase n=1 Tax=Cyanophyceae TaxID=3028117 RepID=UPI0016852ACA|nr:metal-dependent phosphohydrolase [Microcoleus sp. FACHB-1515]MBD2092606.1 metal-dependent phosphohydrolase [Microcoleus sp. FACHB-1515]
MLNLTETLIDNCIKQLKAAYCRTYGDRSAQFAALIGEVAHLTLGAIAQSDAPYHNVEHTILVSLVGQEILRGKQLQEGTSHQDWLHLILALLCHDVGYAKGICQQDRAATREFATGIAAETIALPIGTTDASLTPYHVDRSKQFVRERLTQYGLLDDEAIAAIERHIELTRFPVPPDADDRATSEYSCLARAADLIGQLSDPRYLQKLPALFYEFTETGMTRCLGYTNPDDLRAGYPHFYHSIVYPLIEPALQYLQVTSSGQQVIWRLEANLWQVEQECLTA